MLDVPTGRNSGSGRFCRDGRIYGTDVGLYGRFLSVLRITGKSEESYGSENRENRYDDDELDEGKSSEQSFSKWRPHYGKVTNRLPGDDTPYSA